MDSDMSITAHFTHTVIVVFPDATLEAVIREAIGSPTGDIYPSDLQSLTRLTAQESSIASLTGLQYCTNLQEIDLKKNQISDISPLLENSGLGTGDKVDLTNNPLRATSVNIHIPQLEERGVEVIR